MESQIQYHLPNKLVQKKHKTREITWAITFLFAWLPSPAGGVLRNWVYKTIFSRLGHSVNIQTNVSITDANCVVADSYINIDKGSVLDARGENAIILRNRVFLDRDVRISCSGNRGKVELQENVHLDRGVDIKIHGDGITSLGARTYVGPYSCLSGYGDITIGKDCLIASHTSIYAHNYNYEDPVKPINQQGYNHKGIIIQDNCWIGSGVRILDGITIGAGSIIGAGAIVTKSIPPNSIAVGSPAKVIKKRTSQPVSQTFH